MNLREHFESMMAGVALSSTLTDVEKTYIVEMLQEQLETEEFVKELNKEYQNGH